MKRSVFALTMALALPSVLPAEAPDANGPVWMMVVHEVKDYAAWRAVFDSGLSVRHGAGELGFDIIRYPATPNDIIAIFQWDTADRARAFVYDPAVRNAMKAAGVLSDPVVTFHDGTARSGGG